MSPRILVVEDEADVRELITLHLRRESYTYDEAADGAEGLGLLKKNPYDLIVLDWMLPHLNGLELVKAARGGLGVQAPILMVTARVEPVDIVLGLESGADDYITKPFEIPVLLARVRALLRRSAAPTTSKAPANHLQHGSLKVDLDAFEASISGEKLPLTRSEFNLLVTLLQNGGKVLTRDQLIDLIRGEDISIVQRAIDTHIFGLRKKLGNHAEIIETIRGIGYRVKPS